MTHAPPPVSIAFGAAVRCECNPYAMRLARRTNAREASMRAIRRALRFSRAAQSLVSLVPSLALTACATAVPQAEIDEYYLRCVQGADPATMQAAYCGVAIDSG